MMNRLRAGRPPAIVRLLLLLLAALFAFAAAGCAKKTGSADEKVYRIYYINIAEDQLRDVSYTPVSESFDGILNELLEQFSTDPAGKKDIRSALPEGVKINGCQMGIDELTVDFNAAYLGLSNTREVLLRSALVLTLLKLPDVLRVRFTVEGQALSDRYGEEIGAMNQNTFVITNGAGINSYQYLTLGLYFPNKEGNLVCREMRNVFYSSNLITQQLIVEQIILGPANEQLTKVADPNVKINDVSISGKVCTIDLDSTFNNVPPDCTADPETCLYAFVNSICDSCDVETVRFRIDGSSDVRFRGEISLDREFERKAEIIEPSGSAEIFGGVLVTDPGGSEGTFLSNGDEASGESAEKSGADAEKAAENSAEEKSADAGDTHPGLGALPASSTGSMLPGSLPEDSDAYQDAAPGLGIDPSLSGNGGGS